MHLFINLSNCKVSTIHNTITLSQKFQKRGILHKISKGNKNVEMSLKSLKSKDIRHYFTPKLLNVLRYYMTLIFNLLHSSIVPHKPIKTIDVYNVYKYVAQQKENHIILIRIKQQLSIGNIHIVFPCIIGKVNLDRRVTI